MKNIQKQIDKAQKIVTGQAVATKAKFLTLKAKTKQLNQTLIDKAYALAGIKGYVTNLDIPNQQVIDYYLQLFRVEASFRMAKSDLKARPIFHWKRDSIEAHLTIVLTSLAVGRNIEAKTGISIKQFVKIIRPIRFGVVIINGQEYPAKEIIPDLVQNLLRKLDSGY
jgi:transposase